MFNVRKNMTFFEFLQTKFRLLKTISRYRNAFSRYRNAYKNYMWVIYRILRNKYPIDVVLKNGEIRTLKNVIEVHDTSDGLYKFYHLENKRVIISMNGKEIHFFGGINNGDLRGVFLRDDYKFLPVDNKIVLDIGANIGDTAIYFAVNNASKVIALEPYQNNFEIAKKNISLNKLEQKIEIILAGCSSKSGFINLEPDKGSLNVGLHEVKTGIKTPLLSLQNLVEKYEIKSGILKMDCEGCEYDSILETANEILQKFSHIQIEYHYGYKNLKEKLESAGFSVKITKPNLYMSPEALPSKMFFGFLYATNRRK